MARKLALLATVMLMTTGAAHAQDEPDMGGADLTGVDGSDQGASAPDVVPDLTVGSPAQQFFSTLTVWDRLAECESNGRWHINSGNGYSGGLQFDVGTWAAYGGTAYTPRAYQASREQQIVIAERLHAARGYQPWPVCSRILRL